MSTVNVTSSVPIPAKPNPRKGKSKYPFRTMRIGESFFVPGAKPSSLQSMARRATKDLGYEFTTRAAVDANGQRGARCWRQA